MHGSTRSWPVDGGEGTTTSRSGDLGLIVLIVVLFGGAFPATEVGLEFLPPLLLAAARYALSAVVLLGYAAATTSYWRPRTRDDWVGVSAGGVLFIGGTGLTFVGIQFTTSGVAAIVFSLVPVLTVLFGWLLLPTERPSSRGVAAVFVGWLFLGEQIVASALAGLLVVFVGFVVLEEKELTAELARYRGAGR